MRGPLHGVPVLIKDNIDTADRMMTTAGSLALVGPAPAKDAFVAQKLREAETEAGRLVFEIVSPYGRNNFLTILNVDAEGLPHEARQRDREHESASWRLTENCAEVLRLDREHDPESIPAVVGCSVKLLLV